MRGAEVVFVLERELFDIMGVLWDGGLAFWVHYMVFSGGSRNGRVVITHFSHPLFRGLWK